MRAERADSRALHGRARKLSCAECAAAACASCSRRPRDERIVAAAQRLRDEGIAEPILPEHPNRAAGSTLTPSSIVEGRPESPAKVARRLASKPLFHAGLMVKAGDADAMVAGVAHDRRARVIEAGMMTIGLAPGIETPSSFFLVVLGRAGARLCRLRSQRRSRRRRARRHRARVGRKLPPASARGAARRAALVLHQGQRRHPHVDKVAAARSKSPARARRRSRSTASCRPTRRSFRAVAAKKLSDDRRGRRARERARLSRSRRRQHRLQAHAVPRPARRRSARCCRVSRGRERSFARRQRRRHRRDRRDRARASLKRIRRVGSVPSAALRTAADAPLASARIAPTSSRFAC